MNKEKVQYAKALKDLNENVKEEKGPAFAKQAEGFLKENAPLQDSLGLTTEKVEAIYGQAYICYNTGRYADAAEIFRMLIMLNSTEPKFLMGLAACFHMMKEYAPAIQAYTLCSVVDPNNPIPYFHESDCYLHLGDKHSAVVALEMAVKRSAGKAEFSTLKERAAITLKALKQELGNEKK